MRLFQNNVNFLIFLIIICSLKLQSLSKLCSGDLQLCFDKHLFPCCDHKKKSMYCCDVYEFYRQYITDQHLNNFSSLENHHYYDTILRKYSRYNNYNFDTKKVFDFETENDKVLTNFDFDNSNVHDKQQPFEFNVEENTTGGSGDAIALQCFLFVFGVIMIVIVRLSVRKLYKCLAVKFERNRDSCHQDESGIQNINPDDSPDTDFNVLIVSQHCIISPMIQSDSEIILTQTNSTTPSYTSAPPSYENCELPPPSYDEAIKEAKLI